MHGLEESDDGCYEATVAGTDDYSISVTLQKNGEISKLSCDCPYEFGNICKHEVAVLLAVKKNMKQPAAQKPRKSKNEKANLKELLEAQTKETLAALLYSMAEDDRALRQTLLLRFSERNNELELSRKLIKEHIRRHTRRGFIEWNEADAALTGAWEVLNRADEIAQADCIRAVRLCFVILPEVISVLDYCDDSKGGVGAVMYACTEAVRKAAEAGQTSLPKHRRDELFDLIAAEVTNDVYRGWFDIRLSLWECLTLFCGDPALYQKLFNSLEAERNALVNRDRYDSEALARLQLQLLTQWDSKDKSRKFMLEHLHYNSFRRQAIDDAMKARDYETALRYAREGIEQDEAKQHHGYVHEWRVACFNAYKAMGDVKKMRELAEHFVKHERNGMDYYGVLKDTTPKEKWPELLLGLLRFFESGRHPSATYPQILIVEKDFDRLMAICRKNHSCIAEYGALFPEAYKQEVHQIYHDYVLAKAKTASDRRMYKDVCQTLQGLRGVCGKTAMNHLVLRIKAEHLRQPAFLDELGKLK